MRLWVLLEQQLQRREWLLLACWCPVGNCTCGVLQLHFSILLARPHCLAGCAGVMQAWVPL
jgi:hypothetical protein